MENSRPPLPEPILLNTQSSRLFLERSSYRQRRLMDALRLLPLAGLLLWMVPLLWPIAGGDATADALVNSGAYAGSNAAAETVPAIKMSQAVIYVFCVWGGLILCAAGLWARLNNVSAGMQSEDDPEKTGS